MIIPGLYSDLYIATEQDFSVRPIRSGRFGLAVSVWAVSVWAVSDWAVLDWGFGSGRFGL